MQRNAEQKRDFDKEAALWDANPLRVKLADDVADAIIKQVKIRPDMDVLDFGCGTGLVLLRLQPSVHSITGFDSSKGMLEVLSAKVRQNKLTNVILKHIDIENEDVIEGKYHLIVSSMTLHHIKDVKALLEKLYSALISPSGYLCIADLDSEDGSFHEDNKGVFHNGFDRSHLRSMFISAGFKEVQDMTASTVVKHERQFSVFLFTGVKS